MKLRSVKEILPETRVILKMDLDVPMAGGAITNTSRLEKSIPTIRLLLEKRCKVAVIGKLGRPKGADPDLSLKPVYLELMSMLASENEDVISSVFVEDISNFELLDKALAENQIVLLENLRYFDGEENNDPEFLQNLVSACQFFVNDALAVSHRIERSNMLFKEMPGFYGLSFVEEAEKIMRVVENPQRPLTVILGGAKEDKLKYLERLSTIADYILIGGKLPQLMNGGKISTKVVTAKLRDDGWDLSPDDIAKFKTIILNSKMVIWAGAMGWFEKESAKTGTQEIARAVADSSAYKIVAGGDTSTSVKELGMLDRLDLVASGGGMLLELLTQGKLPACDTEDNG